MFEARITNLESPLNLISISLKLLLWYGSFQIDLTEHSCYFLCIFLYQSIDLFKQWKESAASTFFPLRGDSAP